MDAGFDAAGAAEGQSVEHGNCKSRGSSMGVCDRRMRVCRKVANLRPNLAIPQGAAALPPEAKIASDFFISGQFLRLWALSAF